MESKQATQDQDQEPVPEVEQTGRQPYEYDDLPEDHPVAKRIRALEEKVFGKHSLSPLKNDDRTKA